MFDYILFHTFCTAWSCYERTKYICLYKTFELDLTNVGRRVSLMRSTFSSVFMWNDNYHFCRSQICVSGGDWSGEPCNTYVVVEELRIRRYGCFLDDCTYSDKFVHSDGCWARLRKSWGLCWEHGAVLRTAGCVVFAVHENRKVLTAVAELIV